MTLGTADRPLRIAIIGAGPAGFYTAEALLKQKDLVCTIDFFNRFPTPFGLVREGVAPDHQSIKAVIRVYDRIAANPQVRYFGNVTFGTDVTHDELRPFYDQIVYAIGAQTDRRMGIPGELLDGSHAATVFVGWYNAHPDYYTAEFDLSCERAVIVGNGNVAMDVARILITNPDELAKTDIADHALEALRKNKVREVVMLGRRGPVQAAFTTPELKEFGELEGVDILIDPKDMELDPLSAAAMAEDKVATRNVELLRTYAARGATGAARTIHMRFFVSPVELLGGDNGRVSAVRIEHNQLVPDGSGGMKAQGLGTFETIEAGLVFRSVGYRGKPTPGVPFDEKRGVIPNDEGRVLTAAEGTAVLGEYAVGWIKRGPSGIIGTNKPDAVATVERMLEDIPRLPGISEANRNLEAVPNFLRERQIKVVTYADWKTLDQHETSVGTAQGRPRVKVSTVDEMIDIIDHEKNNGAG